MKRVIYIFILLAVAAHAQNGTRIRILPNPDDLFIWGWSRDTFRVLDTTQLKITYRLEYQLDTLTVSSRSNLMILQIGDLYSKYYSLVRDLVDIKNDKTGKRNLTLGETANIGFTNDDKAMVEAAGDRNMNGEIWINKMARIITDRYHSLSRYNESVEYEEPIPQFDWKLSTDTMTMCNYLCMRAETEFRGRKWIAWFTLDIPISQGPWKFGGLPGLILEIKDTEGHYNWTCLDIKQVSEPILYFNTKVVNTTRKKWLRYYRTVHEKPFTSIESDGEVRVYSQGKIMDETWSIPYNPIELE